MVARRLVLATAASLLICSGPLVSAANAGPRTPQTATAWIAALREAPPARRMDIAYDLEPLIATPQRLHATVATLSAPPRDLDAETRAYIADALGAIAKDPGIAIPALTRMLGDPDPTVSMRAALALQKFGSTAIPALNRVLEERSAALPSWIVDGAGSQPCPRFDAVSANAVYALSRIGDDAVPDLARLLDRAHLNVAAYAAFGLSQSGSEKSVAALVDALHTGDAVIERHVLGALTIARTAAWNRRTLPAAAFRASFRDPDPRVRKASADAITMQTKSTATAAAALESVADDPDAGVRIAVIRALGIVALRGDERVQAEAVGWLTDRLKRGDADEQTTLLAGLAGFGVRAKSAGPAMASAIVGGATAAGPETLGLYLDFLDSIRADDAATVTILATYAQAHPASKSRIVRSLLKMGPSASAALETLGVTPAPSPTDFPTPAVESPGPPPSLPSPSPVATTAREAETRLSMLLHTAATSGDAKLRMESIGELLESGVMPKELGSALTAYVVQRLVTPEIANYDRHAQDYFDAMKSQGDNCGAPEVVAPAPAPLGFPRFPWPPPAYSSETDIPRALLGGPNITMHDAAMRLFKAVVNAGFPQLDSPFLGIPESGPMTGFVLVTPLEQADADWKPLPGEQRFDTRLRGPSDLAGVLAGIFGSKAGYFRMFVIAVTPDQYVGRGSELTEEQLAQYIGAGRSDLPPEFGKLPLRNAKCFAFVYQFTKKISLMELQLKALPGAETQLQRAGILKQLTSR
jgi:HEAT repeat protein